MEEKLTYRVREACDMVGLSRAELYRAIKRGDLRTTKFGRATRIAREDLEAFVQAKRQETQHLQSSVAEQRQQQAVAV